MGTWEEVMWSVVRQKVDCEAKCEGTQKSCRNSNAVFGMWRRDMVTMKSQEKRLEVNELSML